VKNTNTFLGIVLVMAGLMDILIIPIILQRFWTQQPPQSAIVLKMVRFTGLIMTILGLLFLAGVIALP
jgi:hypothetical protein